ncbi:MAG: IlvD/Edd family dehydratase [Dehalococcoidia bacterium]|nr:IlvD/Edd family dehydratase [Dehalococcoidia bacterium]
MATDLTNGKILRSAEWFGTRDLEGFLHRAGLKNQGWSEESFAGRPVIGIANSWSEATHCNAHLRGLAEHVKRGVLAAGGFPIEFPTISLGEFFLSPTSMFCRNLMSMDTEEMIRGLPIDGVVLLSGCDKTTPAMLMGAASADLPAVVLTGGPQLKGNWKGEELGSCTDCRRYWAELRAGTITQEDYDSMEAAIYRSPGHCMVMGTASTMGAIVETLGMSLPGGAAVPGADSRRKILAEDSGRAAVDLVRKGIRPSDILTQDAFDNAIIHLTAIAGRAGIKLPLERFNELSESTPVIVNLKPGGKYLMEDLFYAGGIEAVLKKMSNLLQLDCLTVTGKTLGDNIVDAECHNDDVVLSPEAPLAKEGGLTVLKGSLAPDGAVIKHIAASPELMKHTGRTVVFENPLDLKNRIDDLDLDVTRDDILVMKGAGPVGGPGMPEAGFLPLPKKLLAEGVRDMVRISDARMSGTAFGTIVLHVSPESTVGGPLALVQSGDMITLDVEAKTLDLNVNADELDRRRANLAAPAVDGGFERGYGKMYSQHITQAQDGCDFDFLIGKTPVETHVELAGHNAGFHTG